MTDHPFVRDDCTCPVCAGVKDRGLLLCWPCHHTLKAAFNGGYGQRAEALLDQHETWLQEAEDRWEAWRS